MRFAFNLLLVVLAAETCQGENLRSGRFLPANDKTMLWGCKDNCKDMVIWTCTGAGGMEPWKKESCTPVDLGCPMSGAAADALQKANQKAAEQAAKDAEKAVKKGGEPGGEPGAVKEDKKGGPGDKPNGVGDTEHREMADDGDMADRAHDYTGDTEDQIVDEDTDAAAPGQGNEKVGKQEDAAADVCSSMYVTCAKGGKVDAKADPNKRAGVFACKGGSTPDPNKWNGGCVRMDSYYYVCPDQSLDVYACPKDADVKDAKKLDELCSLTVMTL